MLVPRPLLLVLALTAACGGSEPGESCLVAFDKDTVLDVDVATARLELTLRADGADLAPGGSTGRGAIRLSRTGTGDKLDVPLTTSGPATISVEVFRGTYRVDWIGERDQAVLPAQNAVLVDKLDLNADVVRTFELATATASGAITLDGETFGASSASPGVVKLKRADTGHVLEVPIATGREASYQARVLAGAYDVLVEGARDGRTLPPQRVLVVDDAAIEGEWTRDLALETVTVTGTLTLDGAAVPSNTKSGSRGTIVFTGKDVGEQRADLGVTGPAAYGARLFRSTYQVSLRPGLAHEQTVFPVVGAPLAAELVIDADGRHDFAVKTAQLHGELTVDRSQMADNAMAGDRARLRITAKGASPGLSIPLGPRGPARFDVRVFEGTYDIALAPLARDKQSVLPEQAKTLARGVAIQQELELPLDVPTVHVTGAVRLDGVDLATNQRSGEPRGWVRFHPTDGGADVEVPLGASGPARFDATLFGGAYETSLVANTADKQDGLPAQELALEQVTLTDDRMLDYDARTIRVSGVVTEAGLPLEDATSERGRLVFTGTAGSMPVETTLGSVGPATYDLRVFAGAYDVGVTGAAPVLPAQSIAVHQACAARPAGSDPDGEVDDAEEEQQEEEEEQEEDELDISGTWIVDSGGVWGTWTFEFEHSGSSLGGTFSHPSPFAGSGDLEDGEISEDGAFTFFLHTAWGCRIRFEGQVTGDCQIEGMLRDVSCPNTSPVADWTGTCG